jgi:hypothetical protein
MKNDTQQRSARTSLCEFCGIEVASGKRGALRRACETCKTAAARAQYIHNPEKHFEKARNRPRVPCRYCGQPTAWMLDALMRNPQLNPSHPRCRPFRHGTGTSYNSGCRCDACKSYARPIQLKSTAKWREKTGWTGRIHEITCEHCLKQAMVGSTKARFCNANCANAAQRGPYHNGKRNFAPKPKQRFRIYERDNWTCQLCLGPVDPDKTDVWRASLDHIVPQSRQAVPDHSDKNLRLTHLFCNAARGAGRFSDEWFRTAKGANQ